MNILKHIKMIKLKICGIKDEENAKEISALYTVEFLGLIFAKSIRQVSEKTAQKLAALIHQNHKKVVGVFVDESLEFILKIAQNVGLDGVQIHRLIDKEMFEILQKNNLFIWR